MADISFLNTSAQVKPVDPQQMEVYDCLLPASSAPTQGTAVYFASTGVVTLSDASGAGTAIVDGVLIELQGRGATYITRGRVFGYDLSGSDYGDLIYLSDTAGALSDTVGTVTIAVGKVVPLSDKDLTKVLFINCPTNI